jgi:hypothetical protein
VFSLALLFIRIAALIASWHGVSNKGLTKLDGNVSILVGWRKCKTRASRTSWHVCDHSAKMPTHRPLRGQNDAINPCPIERSEPIALLNPTQRIPHRGLVQDTHGGAFPREVRSAACVLPSLFLYGLPAKKVNL